MMASPPGRAGPPLVLCKLGCWFIRLNPVEGTDKTSDIVLVIERQRFFLSEGAKYDRAWDNCGPDDRIEMFLLTRSKQTVPVCLRLER
jgi:hypothetical protein